MTNEYLICIPLIEHGTKSNTSLTFLFGFSCILITRFLRCIPITESRTKFRSFIGKSIHNIFVCLYFLWTERSTVQEQEVILVVQKSMIECCSIWRMRTLTPMMTPRIGLACDS